MRERERKGNAKCVELENYNAWESEETLYKVFSSLRSSFKFADILYAEVHDGVVPVSNERCVKKG